MLEGYPGKHSRFTQGFDYDETYKTISLTEDVTISTRLSPYEYSYPDECVLECEQLNQFAGMTYGHNGEFKE